MTTLLTQDYQEINFDFLTNESGMKWAESSKGKDFFTSEKGNDFFSTSEGEKWVYETEQGYKTYQKLNKHEKNISL